MDRIHGADSRIVQSEETFIIVLIVDGEAKLVVSSKGR
jgi:hypothetical protein